MKFKIREKKEDFRENWHKKFAWFPTKTDDHCVVWLEFYDRKRRFNEKGNFFLWDRHAIWK